MVDQKEPMLTRNQAYELIGNVLMRRNDFISRLNVGKDINRECGYPINIDVEDYYEMYRREGIGTRIIKVMPEETWHVTPDIVEDQSPDSMTEFEKAWFTVEKSRMLFSIMKRADILSGIGQFGVILLGFNDGGTLDSPLQGVPEFGIASEPGNKLELLYARPFAQNVVRVQSIVNDPTSPRFGLPETYKINFNASVFKDVSQVEGNDPTMDNRVVHWTRVIHLADNRDMSEVFGIPRMEMAWNRLLDIRKILGGSGEMFWRGGFQGLGFEGEEDLEIDTDAMKEHIEDFYTGLQRYLVLKGLKTKNIAPAVADPTPHVQVQMDAIAMALGIPKRILFGSERSHLASTQDQEAWHARLRSRQKYYVSPLIIRPTVERLINVGALPYVPEFNIVWPDIEQEKESDKAETAEKWSKALKQYVESGAVNLMAPEEFFSLFCGLESHEIERINTSINDFVGDSQEFPVREDETSDSRDGDIDA